MKKSLSSGGRTIPAISTKRTITFCLKSRRSTKKDNYICRLKCMSSTSRESLDIFNVIIRATQSVAYPLAVTPLKNSKFNCDLDLWPRKSIGCHNFVTITWVPSLVEIHWTMLTRVFTRNVTEGQTDARTDGRTVALLLWQKGFYPSKYRNQFFHKN